MNKCDCYIPRNRTDSDGDTVCAVCKRVTRVGPMGINGIGFAGITSYASPRFGRVSHGETGPERTVENWEG